MKHRIDTSAITAHGETLSLKAWSMRSGIPAFRIFSRLGMGWSADRAVTDTSGIETPKKQPTARTLTFQGETLTYQQWSERTGISASAIQDRIRTGWSIEKTLSKQTGLQTVTHEGQTRTYDEWAVITGLPASALRYRIRAGWAPERALSEPVAAKTAILVDPTIITEEAQ